MHGIHRKAFAAFLQGIYEKVSKAELVCFQVSEKYRRRGSGRKLFTMICEEALRLGADKLYISGCTGREMYLRMEI